MDVSHGSPSRMSSAGPETLFPSCSSNHFSQQVPLTQHEDDFDDLENESLSTTDLDYIGLRQRLAEVQDDIKEMSDGDQESSVPTEVIFASDDLLYDGARITSKETVVMIYGMEN